MTPIRLKRSLLISDFLASIIGLSLAVLVSADAPAFGANSVELLVVGLAVPPITVASAHLAKMYLARANRRPQDEFKNVLKTAFFATTALVALAFTVGVDDLTRSGALVVFCCLAGVLLVERSITRAVFRRLRTAGRVGRRVLIVGGGLDAESLSQAFELEPELGYGVVGHVRPQRRNADVAHSAQVAHDIVDAASDLGATGVVVSVPSVSHQLVNDLVRCLPEAGLHVELATGLDGINVDRLRAQPVGGRALLYIEPRLLTGWKRIAKRVFDIALAGLALLLTAPVLAVAAIAIRLESPGSPIFRQVRVGQHGQNFQMLKLRTMVADAEARRSELNDLNESDGPLFKIRKDPRITRVGRFLRKTSIDEIPQFWNVLRGEMSVVGPRPALPDEVRSWNEQLHSRLRVLPGITGLWQVSGRAEADFASYRRLDLYYVDNWSLGHDLGIVLRTIRAVVLGRGAS